MLCDFLDCEGCYFVLACSHLAEGRPYIHKHWGQLVSDLTSPPEMVELTLSNPIATEIYYSTVGKIDQHKGSQSNSDEGNNHQNSQLEYSSSNVNFVHVYCRFLESLDETLSGR